jgi:hypothetical protein
MVVTRESDGSPGVGGTMEPWWWNLDGEALLIDFGRVYHDDPDDYWFWHLVQHNGTYYVGLPGVENFHEITPDQAHDRDQLDTEIEECLVSHGV